VSCKQEFPRVCEFRVGSPTPSKSQIREKAPLVLGVSMDESNDFSLLFGPGDRIRVASLGTPCLCSLPPGETGGRKMVQPAMYSCQ
jgi:hypothetical protein